MVARGCCGVGIVCRLLGPVAQKHAGVGRPAGRSVASIESPKRVAITEVLPGDTDAIAGRDRVSRPVDGLNEDEPVWCRWASAPVNKKPNWSSTSRKSVCRRSNWTMPRWARLPITSKLATRKRGRIG